MDELAAARRSSPTPTRATCSRPVFAAARAQRPHRHRRAVVRPGHAAARAPPRRALYAALVEAPLLPLTTRRPEGASMTTAVHPFTRHLHRRPATTPPFRPQLRHMGVGSFRTGFDDVEARLEHDARGAAPDRPRPRRLDRDPAAAGVPRPCRRGRGLLRRPPPPGDQVRVACARPSPTTARVALDGALTMRGVDAPDQRHRHLPSRRSRTSTASAAPRSTSTPSIDRRDWGMTFQAQLPARRRRALLERRALRPPRADRADG